MKRVLILLLLALGLLQGACAESGDVHLFADIPFGASSDAYRAAMLGLYGKPLNRYDPPGSTAHEIIFADGAIAPAFGYLASIRGFIGKDGLKEITFYYPTLDYDAYAMPDVSLDSAIDTAVSGFISICDAIAERYGPPTSGLLVTHRIYTDEGLRYDYPMETRAHTEAVLTSALRENETARVRLITGNIDCSLDKGISVDGIPSLIVRVRFFDPDALAATMPTGFLGTEGPYPVIEMK